MKNEDPARAARTLLTVNEVAELLGISRATVYRLAKDKKLPHHELPVGKRFQRADIEKILADSYRPAA